MHRLFLLTKQYLRVHKVIAGIAIIALAAGGYYWYRAASAAPSVTTYVVQAASTGSVVASVSGTGQVQAGTTINVTPKVSETVTSIPVAVGQHVAEGQLLMQLDSTNEAAAVRADQLALQNAQLSVEELQEITTSTLLSDQNAVREGQTALITASTTIAQDYETGYDDLGTVFADLQTVMAGLQSFVRGNDLSRTQNDPDAYTALMPSYLVPTVQPYDQSLQAAYQTALTTYKQNLLDYHAASRSSSPSSLDALFTETYDTAQQVSAAVKASKDFLTYIVDTYPSSSSTNPLPAITGTFQADFNTYTATAATAVSSGQGRITGSANDTNANRNVEATL